MKTIKEWLAQYLEICEILRATLSTESGHYADEKLAAFETALVQRQEMLDEVAEMEIGENDRLLYAQCRGAIQEAESEIASAVRAMMDEIKNEQESVQNQRMELNKHKRANRGYAGIQRSAEGYFIDKMK